MNGDIAHCHSVTSKTVTYKLNSRALNKLSSAKYKNILEQNTATVAEFLFLYIETNIPLDIVCCKLHLICMVDVSLMADPLRKTFYRDRATRSKV